MPVDHGVGDPPTAVPTTGTPQAIASSGVSPNGSYQGAATSRSAERYQRRISSRGTAPTSRTRSADPARLRRAPAAGGRTGRSPAAPAGGPPTTTHSASGTSAHRPDHVLEALALDQPADGQDPRPAGLARRGRAVRGGTWPG